MACTADKNTLSAIVQLLRKYNLKGTEESLKKEANITDLVLNEATQQDSDVSSVLSAYKSEGDPEVYEEAYIELRQFVESSLDIYKHELGTILYPVLVHMYLELIYNQHTAKGMTLLQRFGPEQESYYQDDLRRLAQVTKKEHMNGNELTDAFKSNQFIIRMSRDTLSLLKRHLQEKRATVLLNIIQEHLYFDMYEGVARNKQQIDATAGGMGGEATRQDNKAKVYYGLPKEPQFQALNAPVEDEDEAEGDTPDKPKKKKPKRDPQFTKKTKSDPNAPMPHRIPFPELRDHEKLDKVKALREGSKRIVLGAETLPSICFYTLLNAQQTVTCAEISEDSSMLAAGFSECGVKVWSLTPQKLRSMKTGEQLQEIDREADDVLVRMMDEWSGEMCRPLLGHSGPVYQVSFSPDRTLLLSCSEDGTVRLWSLLLWTCLVVYRGHLMPVWGVSFSSQGYYFATASADRTARLWATDHHLALTLFAGHFSDVDCVQFHPNCNYVATGSSDRTVCLWDCVSGQRVRLLTGHKAPVHCLAFSSVDGRFLASAGADCSVLVWDLAHGHLVAELVSHSKPVHSLSFSRCGNILSSGGLDCTVKLWDFTKLSEDIVNEDVNISHNPDVKSGDSYLLRSFPTKSSPIIALHYTRRNLLMGIGMFDSTQ